MNLKKSHYMGVDPGANGAIVIIDDSSTVVAGLRLSKSTENDIWTFMTSNPCDFALLEKVHAMPKQGVSSSFKFGMAYGRLRAFLTASRIAWREATPQEWQKGLSLTKGAENSSQRKRDLKQLAEQRFPGEKIVLENADAYLIADYCRKTNWT